jgi:hypothetical protein
MLRAFLDWATARVETLGISPTTAATTIRDVHFFMGGSSALIGTDLIGTDILVYSFHVVGLGQRARLPPKTKILPPLPTGFTS